jgi:ubiquinone/menaquinone biosynthesis C-methylase UbiE
MDKSFESKYHAIEKDHWWCKARRDILFQLVKNDLRDSKILEIGCAGGLLIKALQEKGFTRITGIDISKKAIQLCKKRKIESALVMDGSNMSFSDNAFDIVIASDVLEHIDDDAATLCEWNRVLSPGGKLLMLVPAFPWMWSKHDDINQHKRRYTQRQLFRLLKDAGFSIERASYWNFTIFFPASFIRISQRALPFFKGDIRKDQAYTLPPALNDALTMLVQAENKVLTKANLPFGLSALVVARKNKSRSKINSFR